MAVDSGYALCNLFLPTAYSGPKLLLRQSAYVFFPRPCGLRNVQSMRFPGHLCGRDLKTPLQVKQTTRALAQFNSITRSTCAHVAWRSMIDKHMLAVVLPEGGAYADRCASFELRNYFPHQLQDRPPRTTCPCLLHLSCTQMLACLLGQGFSVPAPQVWAIAPHW